MASMYDADIALADEIMRRYDLTNYLKKGQQMNTYEKQTIASLKDIQYGSGATIDQLIMAYGYFGAVVEFIEKTGYEIPAELLTARDSSKRDLDIKLRDSRKREIDSITKELEALETAESKRAKLLDRKAKLEEAVK
jgi:hypothetical protein